MKIHKDDIKGDQLKIKTAQKLEQSGINHYLQAKFISEEANIILNDQSGFFIPILPKVSLLKTKAWEIALSEVMTFLYNYQLTLTIELIKKESSNISSEFIQPIPHNLFYIQNVSNTILDNQGITFEQKLSKFQKQFDLPNDLIFPQNTSPKSNPSSTVHSLITKKNNHSFVSKAESPRSKTMRKKNIRKTLPAKKINTNK